MSRAMSGHDPFPLPVSVTSSDGLEGVDPLSLFPLPDPGASSFTIDQVWPRLDTPRADGAAKPAWMAALTDKPQS